MEDLNLCVDEVQVRFGGLLALTGVSLQVPRGTIIGVVGPNGAGKTTLLNVINGVVKPVRGKVYFKGQNITSKRPHEITRLGVGRTFQHVQFFGNMTVLETLLLGRHHCIRHPWLLGALPFGRARREEVEHRRRAEELIDFLELGPYSQRPMRLLPYGLQKLVDLGRALAGDPSVLLLDEPSSGLVREEKEDLARFLLRFKHVSGISMLWIEHDLELITQLADRLVVLDFGQVIAAGKPHEVIRQTEVVTAYLGQEEVSGTISNQVWR
jgi:branched-chain amino acid transport system ATP-binding protein